MVQSHVTILLLSSPVDVDTHSPLMQAGCLQHYAAELWSSLLFVLLFLWFSYPLPGDQDQDLLQEDLGWAPSLIWTQVPPFPGKPANSSGVT